MPVTDNWVIIIMLKKYWYGCPVCGNPKMILLREDTELVNYPAYCKRCRNESVITIEPKRRIVESEKVGLSGAYLYPDRRKCDS